MQEDDKPAAQDTPPQDAPPQLFDRVFKALMQLSSPALVGFINGLFGTDYPPDSAVECLETEHIAETLNRWISDKRLIINHTDKYLVEAQMTEDDEMALRVFNYDYLEAVKTKTVENSRVTLDFSRAIVIYLEPTAKTPTELTVTLKFPDKSVHDFTVPTLRLLDYSAAELEERNLSLLLPFYLLKLRKRVKAAAAANRLGELSPEMKALVEELVRRIEGSAEKGLMSRADMRKAIVLTGKLYNGLYKKHNEFEEVNGMVADTLLAELDEAELAGKEIGKEIKAKEIARKLIAMGLDAEKITDITQLDLSTVESLYGSVQF